MRAGSLPRRGRVGGRGILCCDALRVSREQSEEVRVAAPEAQLQRTEDEQHWCSSKAVDEGGEDCQGGDDALLTSIAYTDFDLSILHCLKVLSHHVAQLLADDAFWVVYNR